MNILTLLGSPRKKGNTAALVRTIIGGMEEKVQCQTEYIYLHGLNLSPCRGCGGCEKTGMCVIKDDMIELYNKVDQADVLFLVTPVYFYGPTAQIKTFIDRCQARWSRKYLLGQHHRPHDRRRGYLVSIAATKGPKVFDCSILIAKSFFDAIDVEYGGEFLVRDVDAKGAINERPEELEKAFNYGREIAGIFD